MIAISPTILCVGEIDLSRRKHAELNAVLPRIAAIRFLSLCLPTIFTSCNTLSLCSYNGRSPEKCPPRMTLRDSGYRVLHPVDAACTFTLQFRQLSVSDLFPLLSRALFPPLTDSHIRSFRSLGIVSSLLVRHCADMDVRRPEAHEIYLLSGYSMVSIPFRSSSILSKGTSCMLRGLEPTSSTSASYGYTSCAKSFNVGLKKLRLA